MANRITIRTLTALIALAATTACVSAEGLSEFDSRPTWARPNEQVVYEDLLDYLAASQIAPDRQAEVRDLWQTSVAEADEPVNLLDRLADCLALTDDRVAELVATCTDLQPRARLPEFAWLADSQTPEFVRNNMRLYLAAALVRGGYYDEAIAWTDGLAPEDVVAPAVLLFLRGVAHHQLVQADGASADVARLLERQDELPLRYQKLAQLMQQDLATLEDESLDHIARRMADVRRRLELGRSGQRVQTVENGVIESLDKLIKQIEDQLQQQQSQGASSSGGQPSNSPMQDSRPAELKGPGKVDRRDIGDGADWGNVPPKDREQALQDIGRDFPSHYREIIEEYFRRLASEDGSDEP